MNENVFLKHFKNSMFFCTSFKDKAGRTEYGIYIFCSLLIYYFALHLNRQVNLDDERILNIFYQCLIILFSFVPIQAVTTRRLRDLNSKPIFVIFNFIPVLNIAFAFFLLLAKRKTNDDTVN